MAAGDITFYNKYLQATLDISTFSGMPVDFDNDTLKLIILDVSHVVDTGDTSADEHLDDISADEVATGTAYTGPITLTSVAVSAPVSGVVAVSAANIIINADLPTGFENGRFGVIYKDTGTPATSPLICNIDLGATISIQSNSIEFNWGPGTGQIFTVAQV